MLKLCGCRTNPSIVTLWVEASMYGIGLRLIYMYIISVERSLSSV